MEVVTRDSPKPAVLGEIPVTVRGFPRAAIHGRSRRHSRLTQARHSREITPPFAAHPDPPFAGNGSAARGDDDAAARGDDDAAIRGKDGSATRGFPRPSKGGGTCAFGGPG